MSLSLGEKLRAAREERGISISEVAEQTRISALYLESIENDDYRPLPGGIFNKGFVKSYARFIGFDEQEALDDYSRIAVENEIERDHTLKVYKPEVLTDDNASSSMLPTILFAGIILALMTGGILFVVNYLQNRPDGPETANSDANANVSSAKTANTTNVSTPPGNAPSMADIKVEFRALTQPIRLMATSDGVKSDNVVPAGSAVNFEPKESLTLNYNRWNAQAVQLTINGKLIALPSQPLLPKSQRIEFTISKDNIAQIWTNGAISTEVSQAMPDSNSNADGAKVPAANTGAAPIVTPTRPIATPMPRPSTTPTAPSGTPAPAANTSGPGSNAAPRPTPN